MSQKTSYKAKVQKALILQRFKASIVELNLVHALHIYTANAYIPEEDFAVAFVEASGEPWRWHNLIRG